MNKKDQVAPSALTAARLTRTCVEKQITYVRTVLNS
jgi:hypothetical protein